MASDLGAWPAEQASVLLEVLQRDGLRPEAKRTREGILVLVPDDEADQAHQVLAANMDVIAQAARNPSPPAGRGRRRATPDVGRQSRPGRSAREPQRRSPPTEPRLTSERLLRAGPLIALFLVAMLLSSLVPGLLFPVLVVGAIVGVWVLGKQTQREGGD